MNINVQIDRIVIDSSALLGGADWQQEELLRQSVTEEIQRQLAAMDHPERLQLQAMGDGSLPIGSVDALGRGIAATIFNGGNAVSNGSANEGSGSHVVE